MAEAAQQTNVFSNLMSFARGMANKTPNQQNQAMQEFQGRQEPQGQGSNDPNAQNQQQQKPTDPFELYTGIFDQPDPTKAEKAPSFAIPDEVLGRAASSIDFMSGLPQDIQERLESGEPLDAKTLAGLMNHVGRAAYSKAMQHNAAMTDKFVGLRSEFDRKGLDRNVQKVLATNNLTKIPGSNNPVVKGFLEMTSSALADRYPNESAEWVAEKTHKLFLDMANAMQVKQEEQPRDQRDLSQAGDFSWDEYLNPKQS